MTPCKLAVERTDELSVNAQD